MTTGAGTLVVVPTYDEAMNLPVFVKRLRAVLPEARMLVVDDASPDGTGDLADRLAAEHPIDVLHRPRKSGLGSAYRDGFAWALERGGHDVIVEMDADLSHDAKRLPQLLGALAFHDLVIGSRYIRHGGVENWPRRRELLSRGANLYVQACTGLPVHDATSGFRAFRRSTLEAVDVTALTTDGYAFQIETALRVWEAGLSVGEVPIIFRDRTAGQSKLSNAVIREALLAVPRWGLTSRRARRAGVAEQAARASG